MVGKLSTMRGGGRSTRPVSKRPPNWVVYQPNEVQALIINLAREGKSQSLIGNILRYQRRFSGLAKQIDDTSIVAIRLDKTSTGPKTKGSK